jgi:aminocarboxymuconate-semialdehyde decarboxylase
MFFTCSAHNHDHCTHGDDHVGTHDASAVPGTSGLDIAAPAASAHTKQAVRRAPLRIDIHCHYQNMAVAAMAAPLKPFEKEPSIVYSNQHTRDINIDQMKVRGPKLSDIAVRLADMDRIGIDIQVVSPAPAQYYYYAEPDFGLQLARAINDRIAEIAAGHPDRFVGIGSVPLQHPKMALRQQTRHART